MRLFADVAASLVLWASSLPVLVFLFGLLGKILTGPSPTSLMETIFDVSVVAGCLAWVLLFVMTIAWLVRRQLHGIVPVFGHILGVVGLAPFVLSSYGLALLLVSPGILLVIVVTRFHSAINSHSKSQAQTPT